MTTDVKTDPLAGNRPAPAVVDVTVPFWEGAEQGKLMLQFCPDTERYQFYPRPVSIWTGKRNLEWREASGKGKVYAYTVTHRSPVKGVTDPYIVVTVELDEGVRVMTNLINCDTDKVRVDMPVKVVWTEAGEKKFPVFEPAE